MHPQIGQRITIEEPLLRKALGHAECVVKVEGNLVRHDTVFLQPRRLVQRRRRHDCQRLDQKAPTKRRIRSLHSEIIPLFP
ncbi:hypothetical protein [Streptomyces sp. CA-106131]|uniref:hypothetical protein n=1 Tax=Streptomyces sp. CA-106131 TaxID=3240045 RepID=UPI003D931101